FVGCNSTEFYDSASNTWTVGPKSKYPRSSAGAVTIGHCVYLIGGLDGFWTLPKVEKFDSVKREWSLVAQLNEPRRSAACTEYNGLIYVFGGLDGTRYLRSVERYDPATNTWMFLAPMPEAKSQMALAVVGKFIYLLGGVTYMGFVNSVDVYNVEENQWTTGVSLPRPTAAAAAVTIHDVEICSQLVDQDNDLLFTSRRFEAWEQHQRVSDQVEDHEDEAFHLSDSDNDNFLLDFDGDDDDPEEDDGNLVFFYWEGENSDDEGMWDSDYSLSMSDIFGSGTSDISDESTNSGNEEDPEGAALRRLFGYDVI
ncbi:influenza virus NS1A-binding protein homolog B-like, partial [Neocloeon triangulifer]|uniref:influenza virus NS1A-binding protein homolog B-like n=1 Tax=Neocloeon triangulifer TaxID=2078957 RepID=UPI00286EF20F